MKKAGEQGMLGISVPEKYGGLGMGFTTNLLCSDRMGRVNGSFNTAFAVQTGIGTMPILLYGTED